MLGEVVPRFENHVRLNKDVTDPWGIPVLHASAQYGENEDNMQVDAQNVLEELMHECGIEVLLRSGARREFGQSTHELGTCRMGDDPKTSVLNKWNQAHDVKNLFVVDGSCFVTGGWQNPTLTMLALASRAAEYLAEELRQGSL
jgi:choline dehydrogenase-like flavoprotein